MGAWQRPIVGLLAASFGLAGHISVHRIQINEVLGKIVVCASISLEVFTTSLLDVYHMGIEELRLKKGIKHILKFLRKQRRKQIKELFRK